MPLSRRRGYNRIFWARGMLTEFSLIARYFERTHAQPRPGARAVLGIGDDCALLAPAAGTQLAISTDMLVAGRHFFTDVDPEALGHKALAVNLSDLAAMGAAPRAFTLALALPQAEPQWLEGFSRGLFALADRYQCELIGGDTTGGPLNICITVFGELPAGQALRRDAAQAGDDVWVSGMLGDARLALGALRGEWSLDAAERGTIRAALERPEPRVALGLALRGVAHAALDLSDGLVGDLQHILERSHCSAHLDADALPRSAILRAQPLAVQRQCTLAGGDDYELCFTAPPAARERLASLAQKLALPLTRIGTIGTPDASAAAQQHWTDAAGHALAETFHGFDHFNADRP